MYYTYDLDLNVEVNIAQIPDEARKMIVPLQLLLRQFNVGHISNDHDRLYEETNNLLTEQYDKKSNSVVSNAA